MKFLLKNYPINDIIKYSDRVNLKMDLKQEIPIVNILEREIPPEVIKKLPTKFVNRYQVIPVICKMKVDTRNSQTFNHLV